MQNGRNISAPFQPTKGGGGECAHAPRSRGQTHHLNSAKTATTAGTAAMTISGREENRVDYLSHKFHPLEADEHITFEKYCGPTPESNWVIPGKLLVGAYPASQDDTETFELLTSILRLGVNQFICLQLEYQSGVTEAMWRSGQALRPYFEDVKLLVKNKHKFKILSEEGNVCEIEHLNFVHFPIKDCSVTDDAGVFQLALELVESISKGHVQYLHCWGGHGRTGTLVCIMLHLMYGLTAEEAMRYCQKVHDLRQCPVAVGSPQTQTQRDQVTRIISIVHNQALASRPHSLPAANHHQPSSSTPNKTNSQQNKIETKSTKISSEMNHIKEQEEEQQQQQQQQQQEKEKEKQKETENLDDNGSNSTTLVSNSSSSSVNEFSTESSHVKKSRSLSNNMPTLELQNELQPQKYRVVEAKNPIQSKTTKSSTTAVTLSSRTNSATKLAGPPLALLPQQQQSQQSHPSPSQQQQQSTGTKEKTRISVSDVPPGFVALTPLLPQDNSTSIKQNTTSFSTPPRTDSFKFTPTPPSTKKANSSIKKENEIQIPSSSSSSSSGSGTNGSSNGSTNGSSIGSKNTPLASQPQPPKDRNRVSSSTNKGSVKDVRKLQPTSGGGSSSQNSPNAGTQSRETDSTTPSRTPLASITNSMSPTQLSTPSSQKSNHDFLVTTSCDDRRNLTIDLENEMRVEVNADDILFETSLTHQRSAAKDDEIRVACSTLVTSSCGR